MIYMRLILSFNTSDATDIGGAAAYWATREDGSWKYTVTEVGEHFWSLSVSETSKRISKVASAYAVSHRCIHCLDPLELKTRADVSRLSSKHMAICETCDARLRFEEALARQAAKESKEKVASDLYTRVVVDTGPFCYDDIDLEDGIYALAIYIGCEVSDGGELEIPQQLNFAPWSNALIQAIDRLKAINMLQFSSRSKKDAFLPGEKPGYYTFTRSKVSYRFSDSESSNSAKTIASDLRSGLRQELEGKYGWESVKNVWWKIARADALNELQRLALQYDMRVEEGVKVQESLDYSLQKFSVPQVRNLLWRVTRDAAAYASRIDIIKARAINSIPGSLMRMCDRYLANGWEVKPFTKKWDEEESLVTTTLFDSVLESGSAGFNSLTGRIIDDRIANSPSAK